MTSQAWASDLISTERITDEDLLRLALESIEPELLEMAEEVAAEPGHILTDEEISWLSDRDLRDVYGFEDEDIFLLRLTEDEEKELNPDQWLWSSLARQHILLVNQAIDYRPRNTARPSKSMPSLDWSPKENWVDRKGVMKSSGDVGLPEYISRLAKQFTYGLKLGRQTAIKWAVGIARRWCETGFVRKSGKGQLNPGSRSQACAAIKQWEMMKRRAG